LTDVLSDASTKFTVFAPTNDAFNALPTGVLDNLMKPESKQELADILTYHVLPMQVKSTDLQIFQAVTTVEGKSVHVTKWGHHVRVGPSLHSLKNVVAADNLATSGVAHIIDGVLLPPATLSKAFCGESCPTQNLVELCESTPSLSTLTGALVAADLTDALSDASKKFTVFAPTNDAFNALPAGVLDNLMKPESKQELADILTYHVLSVQVKSTDLQAFQAVTTLEGKAVEVAVADGNVRVGPTLLSKDVRKVVAADNLATNGVAHIIDGVLLPAAAPTQNLVQICESTPNLSILTAAIVAADLADTLSDVSKSFTVFAPTDDAFNALPAGVLDHLMKPENKKELVDVLTYHVLPVQVLSVDLNPFQAATTVEGKPLHVTVWGGGVKVGPSLLSADLKNVIAADNVATNGVAHIVDGVLIPPQSLMV